MIKAIETRFKGYRFRSRLEARYAVFFDYLKIKWEYEKEGYDLGPAGLYLPDFWLPEVYDRNGKQGIWCEIKGQEPTPQEDALCSALCDATHQSVVLCVGLPNEHESYQWNWITWSATEDEFGYPVESGSEVGWDNGQSWHRCYCGSIKMEFQNDYYTCYRCGAQSCVHNDDVIIRASYAARSARFEHGENGR